MKLRIAALAALVSSGLSAAVVAQDAAPAPATAAELQALATTIGKDVTQLRGLPFKRPVGVETQTSERFAAYVRGKIDEEVPPAIKRHYGAIVRALGLYNGPLIDDVSDLMTRVMVSQAGAYYDPQTQKFYVLMTRMPEMLQGALYSHELYHALQDQTFGLERFLSPDRKGAPKNSDRLLARQAVVEGEATYVMTLWTLQKTLGTLPPRAAMAQVIGLQTSLSMEQLREMIQQPEVAQALGDELQAAVRSSEQIPAYLMDEMMGAYLKGMAFVFAIQQSGWPAVEKLYTEYPPQSTEQILHPEKWLAREAPVGFEWPDFGKVAALKDWELLDDDVLGENRWRSVFREQRIADGEAAAAGWGGDRYAVFKRRDSDAMLLLLRTSWDSAEEAAEFAAAYRRALQTKYADRPTPTRVVQDGKDVSIVEGGGGANLDALVEVVKLAKKRP